MAPVAAKMVEKLNATETIFPGTKLHKVFKWCSNWYQVEIRRMPCSVDTLLQLPQRAASQSRVKRERGRRDQKDASGKT